MYANEMMMAIQALHSMGYYYALEKMQEFFFLRGEDARWEINDMLVKRSLAYVYPSVLSSDKITLTCTISRNSSENHTMDSDKSATLNLKFFQPLKRYNQDWLYTHTKKRMYTMLLCFAWSFVTSISEFDLNAILI